MASIYRISKHKVIDNNTIEFYHKDRPMVFVEGKGFCFGEEVDTLWFTLRLDDTTKKEFSLTSNSRIYIGKPACQEREVMDYFRRAKFGKLISSRRLVNYDTDPYGREWENGFYDYEIWDLSAEF